MENPLNFNAQALIGAKNFMQTATPPCSKVKVRQKLHDPTGTYEARVSLHGENFYYRISVEPMEGDW